MRVTYTPAAVTPLGSTTTTLFDSYIYFIGLPGDIHELVRHTVAITNNQTGTLRLLRSEDGTTYDTVSSTAVAIPSSPVTASGPYDFAIDGLKYYKITWVNGGTDQTLWRVAQEITEKQRAAQT